MSEQLTKPVFECTDNLIICQMSPIFVFLFYKLLLLSETPAVWERIQKRGLERIRSHNFGIPTQPCTYFLYFHVSTLCRVYPLSALSSPKFFQDDSTVDTSGRWELLRLQEWQLGTHWLSQYSSALLFCTLSFLHNPDVKISYQENFFFSPV